MTIPIQYVFHTNKYIETLEREEAYSILKQATGIASKMLDQEGALVIFIQQLSPQPPEKPELLDVQYNMLLGLQIGDQKEPIDMIDMKALDEVSVKSAEELAQEIVQKAKQHLAAKKIQGIMISSSGSKLDTRLLENHSVSIDGAGFLLVDGHRLALQTENQKYWVLKAPNLRSYTISRWVNEGEKIRAFDDYDLVRKNKKGMLIDVSKVHYLAIEQLVEGSRKSAENHPSGHLLIERDEMGPSTIQHLNAILSKIPPP